MTRITFFQRYFLFPSQIIFEWYWHIRSALWGLFNRIFRTELSTRHRRCMVTDSFLFLFLKQRPYSYSRDLWDHNWSRFSKGHSPKKQYPSETQQSLGREARISMTSGEAVSFKKKGEQNRIESGWAMGIPWGRVTISPVTKFCATAFPPLSVKFTPIHQIQIWATVLIAGRSVLCQLQYMS